MYREPRPLDRSAEPDMAPVAVRWTGFALILALVFSFGVALVVTP